MDFGPKKLSVILGTIVGVLTAYMHCAVEHSSLAIRSVSLRTQIDSVPDSSTPANQQEGCDNEASCICKGAIPFRQIVLGQPTVCFLDEVSWSSSLMMISSRMMFSECAEHRCLESSPTFDPPSARYRLAMIPKRLI